MQEKIQTETTINNFMLPQILPIEDQKQRLRCPNNNNANSVCISSQCQISGLMCYQAKCQCRKIHYKCHHILLDRVLQSIQKHQKKIPQKVKQTYKTIYDMINDMIEKLSLLRTKFQKQEQYFGLRQQQLQFMELINEHKTQQINGKIISSLQKTFDVDIELSKNTKEQIINDFQNKRKQFDKLCFYIQQNYLQTKIQNSIKNYKQLFKDSKIIKTQQQNQLLNKWLCQTINNSKKILQAQLLFRASEHNFQSKQFHKYCDGKNETLTIVKNQYNKIIGGYTPKAWKSSPEFQPVQDNSGKSFVYSLSQKQKYQCTNPKYSIQSHNDCGPRFGGNLNADLSIYNKCNANTTSYGSLGYCYNLKVNETYKYSNSQETKFMFLGNNIGNTFKVIQYEVYQIKGL